MVKQWFILVTMSVAMAIGASAAQPDDFRRLDSLIAAQPQIIADKEVRLTQMKADLDGLKTSTGRYEAMKRLYEEYAAYVAKNDNTLFSNILYISSV